MFESTRSALSATGHPRGQTPHAAAAGDLVEGSKLSRETSRGLTAASHACMLTHERIYRHTHDVRCCVSSLLYFKHACPSRTYADPDDLTKSQSAE